MGYELEKLKNLYGVSDPTLGYMGTTAPTLPANANADQKTAYNAQLDRYNEDQGLYKQYSDLYKQRLLKTNMYDPAQNRQVLSGPVYSGANLDLKAPTRYTVSGEKPSTEVLPNLVSKYATSGGAGTTTGTGTTTTGQTQAQVQAKYNADQAAMNKQLSTYYQNLAYGSNPNNRPYGATWGDYTTGIGNLRPLYNTVGGSTYATNAQKYFDQYQAAMNLWNAQNQMGSGAYTYTSAKGGGVNLKKLVRKYAEGGVVAPDWAKLETTGTFTAPNGKTLNKNPRADAFLAAVANAAKSGYKGLTGGAAADAYKKDYESYLKSPDEWLKQGNDLLQQIISAKHPTNEQYVSDSRWKDIADAWTKSANMGNANAQSNLGVIYAMGSGVARNDVEAMKWLNISLQNGYAGAKGNIDSLSKRMTAGQLDSANKMATAYIQSQAPTRTAADWLKEGNDYLSGTNGVKKDDTKAANAFMQAAKLGNSNAQSNLGVMYAMGMGVNRDDVEAAKWMNIGLQNGYVGAKGNLDTISKRMTSDQIASAQKQATAYIAAQSKASTTSQTTQSGTGTAASAAAKPAINPLTGQAYQATNRFLANDQYANSYDANDRNFQDLFEQKVAALENKKDKTAADYAELGSAYLGSVGAKRGSIIRNNTDNGALKGKSIADQYTSFNDFGTAMKYYAQAAAMGNDDAKNRLNTFSQFGVDVSKYQPQPEKTAAEWLKQGNDLMSKLGMDYASKKLTEQEYTNSSQWKDIADAFAKAANMGDGNAQSNLGVLYAIGRGVGRDDVEAAKWLNISDKGGYAGAKGNLDALIKRMTPDQIKKAQEAAAAYKPLGGTTITGGGTTNLGSGTSSTVTNPVGGSSTTTGNIGGTTLTGGGTTNLGSGTTTTVTNPVGGSTTQTGNIGGTTLTGGGTTNLGSGTSSTVTNPVGGSTTQTGNIGGTTLGPIGSVPNLGSGNLTNFGNPVNPSNPFSGNIGGTTVSAGTNPGLGTGTGSTVNPIGSTTTLPGKIGGTTLTSPSDFADLGDGTQTKFTTPVAPTTGNFTANLSGPTVKPPATVTNIGSNTSNFTSPFATPKAGIANLGGYTVNPATRYYSLGDNTAGTQANGVGNIGTKISNVDLSNTNATAANAPKLGANQAQLANQAFTAVPSSNPLLTALNNANTGKMKVTAPGTSNLADLFKTYASAQGFAAGGIVTRGGGAASPFITYTNTSTGRTWTKENPDYDPRFRSRFSSGTIGSEAADPKLIEPTQPTQTTQTTQTTGPTQAELDAAAAAKAQADAAAAAEAQRVAEAEAARQEAIKQQQAQLAAIEQQKKDAEAAELARQQAAAAEAERKRQEAAEAERIRLENIAKDEAAAKARAEADAKAKAEAEAAEAARQQAAAQAEADAKAKAATQVSTLEDLSNKYTDTSSTSSNANTSSTDAVGPINTKLNVDMSAPDIVDVHAPALGANYNPSLTPILQNAPANDAVVTGIRDINTGTMSVPNAPLNPLLDLYSQYLQSTNDQIANRAEQQWQADLNNYIRSLQQLGTYSEEKVAEWKARNKLGQGKYHFASGGRVKTRYATGDAVDLSSDDTDTTDTETDVVGVDPSAYDALLSKYKDVDPTRLAAARADYRAKQQAMVDQLSQYAAAQKAEKPDKSEMYFRLAQAFLTPGKTGSFGEGIANASGVMADYKKDLRAQQRADAAAQLQLGMKQNELLANMSQDDLQLLEKQQAKTDAARQAIDLAKIRAGATTSGMVPELAKYQLYRQKLIDSGVPEDDMRVRQLDDKIKLLTTRAPTAASTIPYDDDTLTMLAKRVIAGDKSALTGLGRSTASMAAVQKRVTQLLQESGASPEDIIKAQQTLGQQQKVLAGFASTAANTQGGQIAAMNMLTGHIQILEQAAAALQRGDVAAFNRVKSAWEKETNQPLTNNLSLISQMVGDELQKAAVGGVGGVDERQDLKNRLYSPGANYNTVKEAAEYASHLAAQRVGVLKQQWSAVKLPEEDFNAYLTPATQAILSRPAGPPARPAGVPLNAGYSPSQHKWYWKDAQGRTMSVAAP